MGEGTHPRKPSLREHNDGETVEDKGRAMPCKNGKGGQAKRTTERRARGSDRINEGSKMSSVIECALEKQNE